MPLAWNFSSNSGVPYGGTEVSEDDRLIAEARAGHTAAFGQLVKTYQNRLFNTLAHYVGSPEEAEDVAQEAFVQAFVKLDSFKGDSAFYTWLYRIAFNISVSRARRRRPETSIDRAKDVGGKEPQGMDESPSHQLERKERVELVQSALRELNDEYRAILILRELEGCSYESIAEVLELPIGTVRSRIHRGRKMMREALT